MSPYHCSTWILVDYVVQRKAAVSLYCQTAGVCSVLGTAKLPHFISTLLQFMALEFNLLALSFSDSYRLRGPWRPGLRPITWESNKFQYPNLIPMLLNLSHIETISGQCLLLACLVEDSNGSIYIQTHILRLGFMYLFSTWLHYLQNKFIHKVENTGHFH